MKKFEASDLQKLIDQYDANGLIAREIEFFRGLLAGKKMSFADIPRREGFRRPSKVRNRIRRTLRKHNGFVVTQEFAWIEPK